MIGLPELKASRTSGTTHVDEGGKPQMPSFVRSTTACSAIAFGALLLGSPVSAVEAPAANTAWGGCTLSSDTVDGLQDDIVASDTGNALATSGMDPGESIEVGFAIVFARENDNDGQQLQGGPGTRFTGPVICINAGDGHAITDRDTGGAFLTEATDIPTGTDPGASTIDIRGIEEILLLQYLVNGGARDGKVEKRVCLTVDGNTNCFLIYPE